MQSMVFTPQATALLPIVIGRDGKAVKTGKSQETCQMKTSNILLPGKGVYV